MHDLGDPYTSAFDNTVDGTLTAATTAVLTVTLPDGSTTAPAVTQPSTGRYRSTYIPVQTGRHILRWVSTGPGARAHQDVLNVREATLAILGLDEARGALNFDDDDDERVDDAELRAMNEAATRLIEVYRNEVVARRTVTETRQVYQSRRVTLSSVPVISVTSIATADGVTTWPVGGWQLDGTLGTLTAGTSGALTGNITFVYVAGRVVVPAHYIEAAKVVIADLWQTQRWSRLARQPAIGSEGDFDPRSSGGIPPLAAELLGGRPPVLA